MPPNWKSGSISLSIESKEMLFQQRIKTEMYFSAKFPFPLVTFTPLALCLLGHKWCCKWRNHYQIRLLLLTEVHQIANFFISSLLAAGRAIVKHAWILIGLIRSQGAIWVTSFQSHRKFASDLINQSIRGIRSEIWHPLSLYYWSSSFWSTFDICLLEVW